MELTAKDKKLIVIAGGLLLVLAIIMFGIKPGISGYMAGKDEKKALSEKKATMQTEINALPTYKIQLEDAVAEYNTTAGRVYGDLTNDKIHDSVVNDLVTPCGLTMTSFNINSVEKLPLAAFTGKVDDQGNTEVVLPPAESAVRVANVSINVFGTTDQIITLLDSMNNNEGIYLIQTSFSNGMEQTTTTVSFLMVLSETF